MDASRSDAPRTPLYDFHRSQGIVAFGDVDGWQMPRVFENIKMEYLAAKGTVGVMDRSHHGRLRVSGAKRLDLLHRLTTNDVKGCEPGGGTVTALLTDKGRLVDRLRLHAREDSCWLITSPGNAGRIKDYVERMRFRDDVTVEDATTTTAMITLCGPQAAHLLQAGSRSGSLDGIPPHGCVGLKVGGTPLVAARHADAGAGGFDLIVEAAAAAAVWRALFAEGGPYGASACGEEAWEMVRIESGRPRFGREITGDYNPLEAGLDETICWTKGCYVGQEVIARLDSRQKVTRRLAGLWVDPGPVPAPDSPIEAPGHEGTPVGRLTSVAPSIDFRRVIGLGIVRTDCAGEGSPLEVLSDGDRIGVTIASLPFGALPEARS